MSMILAMVKKDLKLLFRDKMTVFFTFIFPLIFAAFFGSIFSTGGGNSGMAVAVADLDNSQASKAFVTRLQTTSELRVEILPEAEAREATRKGRKVAFILLPPGFGAAYGSLFSGGTPELILGVDPSRKAEAGMLEGVMMKLGVARFEDALGDSAGLSAELDKSIESLAADNSIPPEWQSVLGEYLPKIKSLTDQDIGTENSALGGSGIASALTPLAIKHEEVMVQRDGPKNGYAVTVPQSLYWSIMGVVMGFGVALVQEKTFGTMTRLVAAPISRRQILGGKAAGCFVALFFVVTLMLLVARLAFGVPLEYPLKLLIAILSVAVGFVGIMMFLAALGKTERGMASLGWGVMMIFAMFGGAMIPLFAMPEWMKAVSDFSPVKWAILSFEGATWRQFTYPELMLPCGIMLILGVSGFTLGSRTLKLEES